MICSLLVYKTFREVKKKTNSAVDEALIKNKKDNSKTYNSYIIRRKSSSRKQRTSKTRDAQ